MSVEREEKVFIADKIEVLAASSQVLTRPVAGKKIRKAKEVESYLFHPKIAGKPLQHYRLKHLGLRALKSRGLDYLHNAKSTQTP